MKKLPGGLWPVMLTPFTPDGKVDLSALEELVNFYIDAGSKGLFANCLSSEMFDLTPDERITISKYTVAFAQNRVPVIATGTFSADHKVNATFIKKLSDVGVAGTIINSNQLNGQEDADSMFRTKLEALADDTGNIDLGIYECPVPYKRLVSPDTLLWMAQSDRFVFFKDTSCDTAQINEKLARVKGSRLGLFNANIPTGLDSLKNGAVGLCPIGANYFPELYAFVCDHFNDPELDSQVEKINTFLTLIDTMVHNCYPYAAKWFLGKRGLSVNTYTRTPYAPFADQDTIKFEKLMEAFQEMNQRISVAV